MDTALATQIAKEVVDQHILLSWKFYLLLLVVNLVSFVAASFLHGHFSKRGENFATKADFEDILQQLRLSTTLTAQINSVVSREDWTVRELRTMRRLKLEELLNLVEDATLWLETERNAVLYGGPENSAREPLQRLVTVKVLYFSDLDAVVNAYILNYHDYKDWLLTSRQQLLGLNPEQALDVIAWHSKQFGAHYQPLIRSAMNIEMAARALMRQIMPVAPDEVEVVDNAY